MRGQDETLENHPGSMECGYASKSWQGTNAAGLALPSHLQTSLVLQLTLSATLQESVLLPQAIPWVGVEKEGLISKLKVLTPHFQGYLSLGSTSRAMALLSSVPLVRAWPCLPILPTEQRPERDGGTFNTATFLESAEYFPEQLFWGD